MDSEYSEYGTFDIFYKNGKLEQLGITFCQMSLEVSYFSLNLHLKLPLIYSENIHIPGSQPKQRTKRTVHDIY